MANLMLNFGKPITCFAFNGNKTQVAVGLSDNTVQILRAVSQGPRQSWQKVAVLDKHEGRITGVDWAPRTNKIVSVSSDRNAYVWKQDGNGNWKEELVLLRIPRAATCVKWSPDESKFAAGSSARLVAVCYYEHGQTNCWVSKHIKKPIKSTVMCLDWHPEGILLAAGSSDLTCRILSAYVKDMKDENDQPLPKPKSDTHPVTFQWTRAPSFGAIVKEYKCNAWCSAVKFDGYGQNLAFATHDSTVNIASVGNPDNVITCYGKTLPITSLLWSTGNKILGVGHDRCPLEFSFDGGNIEFLGRHTGKGAATANRFGGAINMFQGLDIRGQSSTTAISTIHSAPISALQILNGQNGQNVVEFVTSGGEGTMFRWNWSSLAGQLSR